MTFTDFKTYLHSNNITDDSAEYLMWDITGLIHCYLKNSTNIPHDRKKRNIPQADYNRAKEKFYQYKRASNIIRTQRMSSRNPYYKLRQTSDALNIMNPTGILTGENERARIITQRTIQRAREPARQPAGDPIYKKLINLYKELTKKDETEKEDCPICLEKIDGDDAKIYKCGHFIHKGCHAEYIRHNNFKCPTCRQRF